MPCAICNAESKFKYCSQKCRNKAANQQKYAKIAQRAIQGTSSDLQRQIEAMQQEIYQLRAENRSFRAQLLAQGRK